jgi:hypothetical protein
LTDPYQLRDGLRKRSAASDEMLFPACKKLRLGSGLVQNAKKIKAKTHLDYLLELFTQEIDERDRKRRTAYQQATKTNSRLKH